MKNERGLVCVFCGEGFGYAGTTPDEDTLKAACEHEAKCKHNPYKAEIKLLEARCKELEADVANLKCCGNCKSFHHCQFLISDTDVIVKPPENFDCDKWEGRK